MNNYNYIVPPCVFEYINNLNVPKESSVYNLGIDFKGNITPSNIPYVKIKIKGVEIDNPPYLKDGFESILDTGAVKLHITPSFAKLLRLNPMGETTGLYPLKGIFKTNVYLIEFRINGIDNLFKEEFHELPYEFQYPLILGTDFLGRCNSLNIDFNKKTYTLIL
jgi:predicted aspartyl protease